MELAIGAGILDDFRNLLRIIDLDSINDSGNSRSFHWCGCYQVGRLFPTGRVRGNRLSLDCLQDFNLNDQGFT